FMGVKSGEPLQHFAHDVTAEGPLDLPTDRLEELPQVLAVHPLHHQGQLAVVGLTDIEDADDLGVTDLAPDAGLAEEALPVFLGQRRGSVEKLDRDGLDHVAEADPVGAPHRTHAALADLLDQDVLAGATGDLHHARHHDCGPSGGSSCSLSGGSPWSILMTTVLVTLRCPTKFALHTRPMPPLPITLSR